MLKSQNIFLIGPMGSGKTAIGKLLAQKLNLDFYDTDALIEKSCGAQISWIFDLEGEEGFRKRETKILQEFKLAKNTILATGGGIILKVENRDFLKKNGWCVFINLDIEEQWRRLKKTKDRPLLTGKNSKETLIKLNSERINLYLEVADFQIESKKNKQNDLVEIISQEFLKQMQT